MLGLSNVYICVLYTVQVNLLVCSYGDRTVISSLLRRHKQQASGELKSRKPDMIKGLPISLFYSIKQFNKNQGCFCWKTHTPLPPTCSGRGKFSLVGRVRGKVRI
jgi:hypothetical protein